MNQDAVKYCMEAAQTDETTVTAVLEHFLQFLSSEFTGGKSVDLGEDFGAFAVKKREYAVPENSPRTAKQSSYIVTFKESSRLKKRLKESASFAGGEEIKGTGATCRAR